MKLRACAYEKEVSEALRSGHWPHGCTLELRNHVDQCSSCADLVLIAEALQSARRESVNEHRMQSPELLWWRAQLRRRYAAATSVSRPITIAQIFAFTLTLLIGVLFAASQYRHGLRWSSWWAELAPGKVFHLLFTIKPDGNLFLFGASLGMLALLGGVVVYLASQKS